MIVRIALAALLPLLLPLLHPVSVAAQEAHRALLDKKLEMRLTALAEDFPGVMGLHVIDLSSGDRFGVNDALVFPQGSSIKISILIELFRQFDTGGADPAERIVLTDGVRTGGSGIAGRFMPDGSALALYDLAVLMIVLSDNTATNILIDRLGMDRINATMRELGAPQTRVQRRMIQPEASARGNENLSTPREAADLMARIARCELPLSAEACARLREVLEIPKSGAFVRPVPSGVAVAWKPGGIEGVQVGWGAFDLPGRPYVLTVMTNYGRSEAGDALAAVSDAVYDHFARLARATPHGARVPLEVHHRVHRDTSAAR